MYFTIGLLDLMITSNANANKVLRLEHALKRSEHIHDKDNDIRVIKVTLQIRKAIILSTTNFDPCTYPNAPRCNLL